MSSKKALLASSLTICTATAPWVMGTNSKAAFAQEILEKTKPDWSKELIAQEAVYQYLNPISAVADGNLAAKVETKPLTHQVQKGDTLYQIGLFYGVHYDHLVDFNQITDVRRLEIGRILNIPLTRKWIRLKFEDSVESLAEQYDTTKEFILYLNPTLKDPDITYVGQLIAVPQKINLTPKPVKTNQARVDKLKPVKEKNIMRLATKPTVKKVGSYSFAWPVIGQITSNFGWRNGRQHKGIDIWNAARAKAEIHSALGGVVVKAGYSGDYGNLVVIDHGGGWETCYAHLSKISVSKGQTVESGQMLGNMGQTGNATGYHLHFEIRKDGQALNPLSFLNK